MLGVLTLTASCALLPAAGHGPSQVSVAEDPAAANPGGYEWTQVPIGAGGFVTGIVSRTRSDGTADISIKTDIGGAFRWDEGEGRWQQLMRASAINALRRRPAISTWPASPWHRATVMSCTSPSVTTTTPRTPRPSWTGTVASFVGMTAVRRGRRRSNGGESWTQVPLDVISTGLSADGFGQVGVHRILQDRSGKQRRSWTPRKRERRPHPRTGRSRVADDVCPDDFFHALWPAHRPHVAGPPKEAPADAHCVRRRAGVQPDPALG